MSDEDILARALRDLPAPEPRPGFADRALAHATSAQRAARHAGPALMRPEIWLAAAVGAAVAAALTWFLVRPVVQMSPANDIALVVNESRNIDVLIESERALHDATIRITVSGPVVLDGFVNERQIDWRTDVEPGRNLLSLPVVARSAGAGRLVAVIEHGGKTRTVTVNLAVNEAQASRS